VPFLILKGDINMQIKTNAVAGEEDDNNNLKGYKLITI